MTAPIHRAFAALAMAILLVAGCAGSSDQPIASFARDWGDGRIETLELFDDGRVLMDHVGVLDRTTLSAADVERLKTSLAEIRPASDPTAFPRLTLTPSGADPVVVATDAGTTGELFVTLLNSHRLP